MLYKRILILMATIGILGIGIFKVMKGAGRSTLKASSPPIQTLRVDQNFIIRDEHQEVIVKFRCPHLGNSGLVTFALTQKSCSCMDGETDVDQDTIPVAVLKFRLSPSRHQKDGAGTFTATTPQGIQLVRAIAKLQVFPLFWTEPDDIRMFLLKGGETERVIRIRAATAFHPHEQAVPLTLMPLPAGLDLLSSEFGTEVHKDVVVKWINTQIKYTRPADASGLQSTCLKWKSGEKEYEKTIFWSCSKGIECRPSHLLVSQPVTNSGVSDELEFRVISAVEPFIVNSVTCSDAELHIERNSDELLRQHSVKLGIALSDPAVRRINLTIHTSDIRGEVSTVELPVIFDRQLQ